MPFEATPPTPTEQQGAIGEGRGGGCAARRHLAAERDGCAGQSRHGGGEGREFATVEGVLCHM